jgi:hypothetical protein
MPGIELNISFEYHEVPADGSYCSVCDKEIFGKMYKYYLSVNKGDPLSFDLLPTRYVFCEPCKMRSDKSEL